MNGFRRRIADVAMNVVVISCLAHVAMPSWAGGKNKPLRVDAAQPPSCKLTIPPSDLWSPEFAKYDAGRPPLSNIPPWPARDAPRAEWEKYIQQRNQQWRDQSLPLLQKIHPVVIEDTTMAGVPVNIITPKAGIAPENGRRVLINLHGGAFALYHGFMQGDTESIPLAALGRIKVITLDYRQAPFYHFPAASEDVEAVYRELLKQYSAGAIGMYGCSAGGALAAQAVARIQDKGLPRPGAIGILGMGLVSPRPGFSYDANLRRGDSRMWGTSRIPYERTSVDNAVENLAEWYWEGAEKDDPLAYPAVSDAVLARFPPTLFLTGTRAFEMSTVLINHARFLKLGVDASLYVMEGGSHCSHADIGVMATPEGHDVNAYIARWFEAHLAR